LLLAACCLILAALSLLACLLLAPCSLLLAACCFILDPCCLPQLDDNLDHVLWMIRKPGREDCRHNPEKVKETTFLYKIKLIDSRSKQLNFIQESEQLISLVF